MYNGIPQFDPDGWYLGPLPKKSGVPLIGYDGVNFKTASAAAWPPQLCEWAAKSILFAFSNSAVEGKMDASKERKPPEEEHEEKEGGQQVDEEKEGKQQVDPTHPPVRGGRGPARLCKWKGNEVPFHDGGCLPSPGRWNPEDRILPGGKWIQLRRKLEEVVVKRAGGYNSLEKECFAMATGEKGCRLVKDESMLEELRNVMAEMIGGDREVLEIAEGQPFRLRLMSSLLRDAGDPDWEFLLRAEDGLPVGVTEPLPRTPAVFEEQVKWNLEEDPLQPHRLEKSNTLRPGNM